MRKTLLSSLIAATFISTAGSVVAAPLIFDPTGTGGATGAYTVDAFDFAPSGVLAVGGNQAIANFLNGSSDTGFQVLSHSSMTAGSLNNVGVFAASIQPWEITMVIGFHETVAAATAPTAFLGGSATFLYDSTKPTFVRMYYDVVKNADMLAGTGFNDGTLIYDSGLTTVFGQFTNQLTPVTDKLDKFNSDNWNGQQTVTGSGTNSTLMLDVATAVVDPDFFKNAPLLQFVIENLSLAVPFKSTDPSYSFTKDDNTLYNVTTDAGLTSTLGTKNGGITGTVPGTFVASGPDFIFQTDVNSSVQGTIPVPGTLALLGLGLVGLGFRARRRS